MTKRRPTFLDSVNARHDAVRAADADIARRETAALSALVPDRVQVAYRALGAAQGRLVLAVDSGDITQVRAAAFAHTAARGVAEAAESSIPLGVPFGDVVRTVRVQALADVVGTPVPADPPTGWLYDIDPDGDVADGFAADGLRTSVRDWLAQARTI